MIRLTSWLCALLLATPALADPSLTLVGNQIVARITGDQMYSISMDELNAYRAEHPGVFKGKYCALKSFEGRADITATTADQRSGLDYMFRTGQPSSEEFAVAGRWYVTIDSGIYQKCNGTTGSVIVVRGIDLMPPKIEKQILWAEEYDGVMPMYIFHPQDPSYLAGMASCLECGEYNEIRWNAESQIVNVVAVGE